MEPAKIERWAKREPSFQSGLRPVAFVLALVATLAFSTGAYTVALADDGAAAGAGDMRVARPANSGTDGGRESSAAPENPADSDAHSKSALQGQVGQDVDIGGAGDLNKFGFRITPDTKEMWPARVDAVAPGSQAWQQGLRAADRVLNGATEGSRLDLTVERKGKNFHVILTDSSHQLQADETVLRQQAATASQPVQKLTATAPGRQPLKMTVSVQDLRKLADHDVVVIIDRSGSMTARDCPHFLSRWGWCGEQTLQMMHETEGYLHDITIVLFSGRFSVYRHCDIKRVPFIFLLNRPGGSTDTAMALGSQLEEYFRRRDATQGRCKPVVFAIITDGVPNDPLALKMEIIAAARDMRRPDEISITFLQVGNDDFGSNYLNELDNYLIYQGAPYDIVDTKTFGELRSEGLTRALVDAINQPRTGNPGKFAGQPPGVRPGFQPGAQRPPFMGGGGFQPGMPGSANAFGGGPPPGLMQGARGQIPNTTPLWSGSGPGPGLGAQPPAQFQNGRQSSSNQPGQWPHQGGSPPASVAATRGGAAAARAGVMPPVAPQRAGAPAPASSPVPGSDSDSDTNPLRVPRPSPAGSN